MNVTTRTGSRGQRSMPGCQLTTEKCLHLGGARGLSFGSGAAMFGGHYPSRPIVRLIRVLESYASVFVRYGAGLGLRLSEVGPSTATTAQCSEPEAWFRGYSGTRHG